MRFAQAVEAIWQNFVCLRFKQHLQRPLEVSTGQCPPVKRPSETLRERELNSPTSVFANSTRNWSCGLERWFSTSVSKLWLLTILTLTFVAEAEVMIPLHAWQFFEVLIKKASPVVCRNENWTIMEPAELWNIHTQLQLSDQLYEPTQTGPKWKSCGLPA